MEKKAAAGTMNKSSNVSLPLAILFTVLLFEFGHGQRLYGRPTKTVFGQHILQNREEPAAADDIIISTDEVLSSIIPEGDDEGSGGGSAVHDEITGGLPGQPSGGGGGGGKQRPPLFKQYGGYVNVEKGKGRSLFYYFAECTEDPDAKPLILWLNGGPGCSSLGAGAFLEIGPFGVNPDGKTLYRRKYAWNRVANVLFVESPAGVGFSYSNTSSDIHNKPGDKRTAQDSLKFLLNWFERYPHYKTRDFYIAGESYAGYYIPQLADLIVKRNNMAHIAFKIQLKGIMIGNGLMSYATLDRGSIDYIWNHALISDETHIGLLKHCDKAACDDFQSAANRELGDGIDPYYIYGPVCLLSSHNRSSIRFNKRRFGYDPCEQEYVQSYLNLHQVQQALHANTTKLPYPWDLCSEEINEKWDRKDSPSTMFPIYKRLIASGLEILLYSGDADAVVPVTSTRYALDAMNLKVLKHWHPWHHGTQEVAGYKVEYEGVTFVTVKGAGHVLPWTTPRRAFTLLNMFLTNGGHH